VKPLPALQVLKPAKVAAPNNQINIPIPDLAFHLRHRDNSRPKLIEQGARFFL
jgi:hypothetical protein